MIDEDTHKKSIKAIREYLANMTEEEKVELKEHFRDKKPKGWLSIEEHIPMMFARDIMEGYSEFKVKYSDGREDVSRVSDGNTWYYYAKEEGLTHWFNE